MSRSARRARAAQQRRLPLARHAARRAVVDVQRSRAGLVRTRASGDALYLLVSLACCRWRWLLRGQRQAHATLARLDFGARVVSLRATFDPSGTAPAVLLWVAMTSVLLGWRWCRGFKGFGVDLLRALDPACLR